MRVGLCGFTMSIRDYPDLFDVVEVQQTFYDPPRETFIARWRAQVPEEFEFTLKAWQLITHRATSRTYRRLRRPLDEKARAEAGEFRWNGTTEMAWKTTLRAARLLRATAVLFQCPASFKATEENAERMRAFFGAIGPTPDLRYLWEPRGPWPLDLVERLCSELSLTHVVDPFVNPFVTRAPVYLRLHGTTGARHVYSDEELRTLWEMVPAEGTTYVMFNNLPRVEDAKKFLALSRLFSGRKTR